MKIKQTILSLIEKHARQYITYHKRPVFASQTHPVPDMTEDVTILIQGPISEFTEETIRFYKVNYPHTTLITSESIWGGVNGPRNINHQLSSAQNGLKHVDTPYVLKTRSDQRMYGINNLSFLKNLLKQFGDRLVGIDFGTHLDASYMFSDMFVFGRTEDVRLWASADYVTTDEQIKEHLDFFKDGVFLAERYLFREYCKKKGWEPKFDGLLDDYYKALAKFACVVDNDSIDIYWPKYDKWEEHRHRSYTHHGHCLGFKDWLNINNKTLN